MALQTKRTIVFVAIVIFLLLTSLVAALLINNKLKTFYVGVTFSGATAAEAKQLIDRVTDYTNLLVVQSNPLQHNISALEDTCDYAVKSGLNMV